VLFIIHHLISDQYETYISTAVLKEMADYIVYIYINPLVHYIWSCIFII